MFVFFAAIVRAQQSVSPIRAGLASPATMTFESGDLPTTLIELFTSEGCSSCPPAEKWLSRFNKNPDLWKKIVPIAFHVDYWDRLGWRDRLAKPEFTERQQHYAASWKGDSVYTPGFAVDGKEWRGWFTGAALPENNARVGRLQLTIDQDHRVSATFRPAIAATQLLVLETALLGSDLESHVKAGENAGRELHHDFVALQLAKTEMSAEGDHYIGSVSLPKTGNDKPAAITAWVHSSQSLQPIQATGGWLRP